MGSEWRDVLLREITNKITKGTTPTKEDGGFTDVGINYIRAESVKYDGELEESSFKLISESTHKKLKRSQLQENDLLFSMAGAFLGKTAIVRKRHLPANTNQALALIRPRPEMVDPQFLLYFLRQKSVIHFVSSSVSQSAQPNINLQEIGSLKIRLPNLVTQRRVASVISCLDNKIELNRQMNTTLEAMAQALFKSWFVDFDPVIDNALAAGNPIPDELAERTERRKQLHARSTEGSSTHLTPGQPLPTAIQQQFPDRFVFTEEMGWVPEGWEAVSLDEIIELIGGGTPKTSIEEYWGGDIPWFSVVDAPAQSDVFVSRTEKSISTLGLENSSTKMLREGTTIISARGTVGKCALVGRPMTMNQSCYGIQGKSGIADYFVYYTILLRVGELQQRGHGSVFNTITRDTFKSIMTPRCPAELTQHFHELIAGFFSRILENNQQSDCLANLRDTLLPKLLSGQLRIPEAEQQVAEIS